MAPRKNRPVLFEVVARTQRARGRSAVSRPPASAAVPAVARPEMPETAALPGPVRDDSIGPRARGLRFENQQLQVALGWPHLVVVGVIFIVSLVVAFQVGKRSAQPPARSPADLSTILANTPAPDTPKTDIAPPKPAQGRSAGPVQTPLVPLTERKPEAEPPPARPTPVPEKKTVKPDEAFEFAADSYYVVIQHFRTRDRERAVAARDFLSTKGIACALRPGAGDLELVATEAFPSERHAQDLVRRILEFGKEYRGAGGGYDFANAKARKF